MCVWGRGWGLEAGTWMNDKQNSKTKRWKRWQCVHITISQVRYGSKMNFIFSKCFNLQRQNVIFKGKMVSQDQRDWPWEVCRNKAEGEGKKQAPKGWEETAVGQWTSHDRSDTTNDISVMSLVRERCWISHLGTSKNQQQRTSLFFRVNCRLVPCPGKKMWRNLVYPCVQILSVEALLGTL